jgi:hypothetical protein
LLALLLRGAPCFTLLVDLVLSYKPLYLERGQWVCTLWCVEVRYALHPLRGSICDHFSHLKSFLLFSKIYETFMSIIYIPVLKLFI